MSTVNRRPSTVNRQLKLKIIPSLPKLPKFPKLPNLSGNKKDTQEQKGKKYLLITNY